MHVIFIGLIPLVLFVLINFKLGQKAGIISAMVSYVFVFGFFAIFYGYIDGISILEGILIFVLGGIGIKMNNAKYFKFQPAVTGIFLGLVFAWHQVFDTPILVKMLPRMQLLMPQMGDLSEIPEFADSLARISGLMGITFFVHAAIVGYCAMKTKDTGWLVARIAIYPMMIMTMFLARI